MKLAKRVLVVGAGAAGRKIIREVRLSKDSGITIAGLVDDAATKQNTIVDGVKVLGRIDDIPRILAKGKFDQILVALPSVGSVASRLTPLVPPGFPVKILPSISSVLLGHVNLSYVRDLDPADILGRSLVKTDQVRIAKKVKGRSFLVTGGAGSIGSEIVRQLLSSGAKQVVVYDSWEEGLFNLLSELEPQPHANASQTPRLIGCIGNVRDKLRLREVFTEYSIDAVFHAAAYKHVPLMEGNPGEAVKTNVSGTRNVLDATVAANIKEFVLISSDKAVRPTNVMGRTKRNAELLMQRYALQYPHIRFCAVRFGNVLNSSGSLVPIVVKQIASHKPVTITHKEMTRYFMTIPEAVSLVLTSWIVGRSGQVLLLDMGEPIKIIELIHSLIRMHGLVPDIDIEVKEIGIRPGEKIHEELAYDQSRLHPSPAPRIFIAEELLVSEGRVPVKRKRKVLTH